MYKIDFDIFSKEIVYPTVLSDTDKFLIKIAENSDEIHRALRLRYEVFNLEQGKGLDRSNRYGIDVDEFDEYCLHLIVVEKAIGEVIGTYRIHLGAIASISGKGFYSSSEYNMEGLGKIANLTMEVGRSCVKAHFRTGAAVALLWAGIAELMSRAKLRYLLGCVSMEKINFAAAWALYIYYKENGAFTDLINGIPREDFVMKRPSDKEIAKYLENPLKTIKEFVPPLMKGYLKLGTKIAGEPVYDPYFKTIDFLILLDTHTVPDKYLRHYNYTP